MTTKTIGYELIVRSVNGFHHAKAIIYNLIREGIVKCGQCDQSATHVFWQDQAEWYCRCDAHREHGQMWTGHTRWNPSSFGLNVIPEKARAWLEANYPDVPEYRLSEYDATDYYKLMPDDYKPSERVWFKGSPDEWFKLYTDLYALKDGSFAYTVTREWTHGASGTSYQGALTGGFDTRDAAIEAARKEAGV